MLSARFEHAPETSMPDLTEPLVFTPHFRPQVWGGRRLADLVDKPLPPGVAIGESWEISAHSRHVSVVESGRHRGRTLDQLWQTARADLVSDAAASLPSFPWLIKWLDCHDVLSVQVHPDDATAQRLLGEPFGKTESWIILHAEPAAKIYAGWKHGVTRAEIESRLENGTIAEAMHSFTPQAGQVVHIPAGTVHALGGGVVVAEIQQTSDATFRLFDWNRVDASGNSRPLHVEQALEALNFDQGPIEPMSPTGEREALVHCPYYTLERIDLNESWNLRQSGLSALIVLAGEIRIDAGHDSAMPFSRGQTILLPAAMEAATIRSLGEQPASLAWITSR
jgi:mannose-6-phosphate isomerase